MPTPSAQVTRLTFPQLLHFRLNGAEDILAFLGLGRVFDDDFAQMRHEDFRGSGRPRQHDDGRLQHRLHRQIQRGGRRGQELLRASGFRESASAATAAKWIESV